MSVEDKVKKELRRLSKDEHAKEVTNALSGFVSGTGVLALLGTPPALAGGVAGFGATKLHDYMKRKRKRKNRKRRERRGAHERNLHSVAATSGGESPPEGLSAESRG